jgi:hypothetical protein
MKKMFSLLVLPFLLFAAAQGRAQTPTVIFQDPFSTVQTTPAGTWNTNWYTLTAHPVNFGVPCSGADLPTCAQINVQAGDDGNNLLVLCGQGDGCPTQVLTVPAAYYTYYKMRLSAGANFGSSGANDKFMYFKNSNGGNVCYYDVVNNPDNTFSLRVICDNATLGYGPEIPYDTNWHTLESGYSSANTFQLWWDGVSQGSITPTSQVMNAIEPGLYTNTGTGSSFTMQLNNFQVCTGARCPAPGSTPPPPPPPTLSLSLNLPNGAVGQPYAGTATVSGGTPPYSYSSSSLAAGLTLAASTGAVTGTPTAAGTVTTTILATDSETPPQMAQATALVTIAASGPPPPPGAITIVSLTNVKVGAKGRVTLTYTDTNPAGTLSAFSMVQGTAYHQGTCVAQMCTGSFTRAAYSATLPHVAIIDGLGQSAAH